ncbi:serine hydrolase domain-containing protein [Streptomyces sp. N50]|uniref:serine hydrolase domain-containing protein n=1 Tax=Streptomyces sp. N50 TaxID=3081765 RepID=UPI0029622F19|nr:serine hydrolase domain-containing protein [Streptomyces sp. N50]WOX15491.1 serine hydrolase domain-containing protein [Streptomyces sp. N50]
MTELLRELAREHMVPGAQLAVHVNGETFSATSGVTDVGRGDPVLSDSAFAFGSVSKVFTATLILGLVSDGDLELDAPVCEYVPELRKAADEAMPGVTLRQLLSHTGGIVADHELDDSEERSLRRYATSVATTRLLHRPGYCFSYANTGYNLLGRTVEAVTGVRWHAAVRDFVLRPLGMDPVFLHRPDGDGARRPVTSHAVRPDSGRAHPVGFFLPPTWAPASALAGSAEDLVAFARMHMGSHPAGNTVLDDTHRRAMRTPVPAADAFGMADGWGLGLARYSGPDRHTRAASASWYGHDGTVDGGSCHLRFQPETGVAVAFTSNASTGSLLWSDLVAELRLVGVPVGDYRPDVPDAPPAEWPEPTGLLGDYGNGDTRFSLRPHQGGIRLSDRTGLVADVTLHDRMIFTAQRVDAVEASYTGRFVLDGDTGTVALMQLGGRSAQRLTFAA